MIRLGVVGLGNMGTMTANFVYNGDIKNLKLSCVTDIKESRRAYASEHYGDITVYSDFRAMIDSGNIDAVYIAVPHFFHPEVAIYALNAGLHVITEKPEAVYTKKAFEMNECADRSGKTYAIMYNQRTNPYYKRIKEITQSGELGTVTKIVWTITNWYRTQCYFDSGEWRATWKGEGAGVLINQSIHNLDLWQWMFGMPERLRAFVYEGKHHDIEVEDEATIYAEYANGANALFITGTGEFPGRNRLEVSYTKGRLQYEGGKLHICKLNEDIREFTKRASAFETPKMEEYDEIVEGEETAHRGVMQNFVDSILYSAPLLSPGQSGINALSISNGALLSSWTDKWVDMPTDFDMYLTELQKRIDNSRYTGSNESIVYDLEGGASGGSLGSK